jgi:hypothetical protein
MGTQVGLSQAVGNRVGQAARAVQQRMGIDPQAVPVAEGAKGICNRC